MSKPMDVSPSRPDCTLLSCMPESSANSPPLPINSNLHFRGGDARSRGSCATSQCSSKVCPFGARVRWFLPPSSAGYSFTQNPEGKLSKRKKRVGERRENLGVGEMVQRGGCRLRDGIDSSVELHAACKSMPPTPPRNPATQTCYLLCTLCTISHPPDFLSFHRLSFSS